MTLGLILKRMQREWRALAVLLLAVCLLTGFFALGPFYIRAVTEVGLRFELDNARIQDRQISLIVDGEPLTPESFAVVDDELGDLAVGYRHYIRADYTPPTSEGGMENPGLATAGYVYRYGEPVTSTSSRTQRTYQPFAFADMPSLLTLVEGRWPVRLPPPEAVDPTGLSDAEQQARQVGIYSRGQVEVVVSPVVAERADLEPGSRITLGTRLPDGTGEVATIVVVGIAEPKDPGDVFWEGNRNFIDGADVEMGLGQFRYDFGFAALPEAYTDWLADVTPGNSYVYLIETNTDAINADNIQQINARIQRLPGRLSAYHPGINVLTGLSAVLQNYSGDVTDTQGPIILLSGAILIMMLYHLINTVALVLEQQGAEWSAIVSRGGSIPQLVMLQAITVGVLGVIGLLVGPLLSVVFMSIMEHIGPLATALGGRPLGSTSVPRVSFYLSIAAAAAAVVVLTAPAFPAARRSLLRLKQLVSRPPTQPAWARFALDGVLIVLGGAFMLRLYYLVGGDFGDLLNNIIAAPRDVIALIADNLNQTGGLNDPFNLLGPALVLTGLALFWLRLFPWLMDLVSRLFRNSRHLTTPLAVWNVARDPNHYAQLVLLLIGTLALGTASLALTETRDRGAWKTAREETGGSARIQVNPAALDAGSVAWSQLPGVAAAARFVHASGDPGSAAKENVEVLGVEPDAVIAAFPELQDALAPLRDVPVPSAPGLELPDNARTLTVQVYSLSQSNPDDPAVAVHLVAYLQDALGVPFSVALDLPESLAGADVSGDGDQFDTSTRPTPVQEWLTFEGPMPERGRAPYRLMRIGINSRQGNLDAFEHAIYLDRVAVQDVFGTSTTLESFEDGAPSWAEARAANPYAASWVAQTSNVNRVQGVLLSPVMGAVAEIEGPGALRLDYRMSKIGGRMREPSIVVNEPDIGRIPVVISPAFAETFAGRGSFRSAADDPLKVGDAKNIVLNLGPGSVEIGYQVAGVLDGPIPSFGENALFMIAPKTLIQPVINQAAVSNFFFDDNEIWLELPDREPGDALESAIAELDGVTDVTWAWTRYGEIQREPLPSAVAGMLFAGFWVSLVLSLLDFGFYLMVTARQRLFTFAVLRSLGWNAGHIWRLLFIEQVVLIAPALIIGSLIGAGLAYLLLPFLALVGSETLQLPWLDLLGMLVALVLSFTILMGVAAIFLRRMSVNQVLRLGEE